MYERSQGSGIVSENLNTMHDGTFIINQQPVTLVNGISEIETAPGSASKVVTKYFGNGVTADLNGDGELDEAFLITQSTGGSGTFFYVVALVSSPNGKIGTHAVLLGDRIAPQNLTMGENKIVIVNYVDRKPGESFSVQPSVGKSLHLKLDPVLLQFGEVEQNFEGEANPSTMKLDMKTWKWEKTVYEDGRTITPKRADKFSLTFEGDKVKIGTDCNQSGGTYKVTGKDMISITDIFATEMFCEGSQESEFWQMLENVNGYHFTSKGELVLNLKFDSGSVVFK